MKKIMEVVSTTPGIGHYAALAGLNVITGATKSNSGSVFCQLKPWNERNVPAEQVPGIADVIRKRMAAAGIKNAKLVVITPPPIPGIGQTAGFSFQIEQRNTNDDVHQFETVVRKFVAEANKNPAISNAFSFYSAHTPGYNLGCKQGCL